MAAGNNEKAEYFLERTYRSRSNWLIDLHHDPRFDSLRGDPRFQKLIEQIEASGKAATPAQS
jgi:hypothetical protein